MKKYIKNNEIKNSNNIIINKNGMNIFNPTKKMLLEDGWEEYDYSEYVYTIEDVKYNKIEELESYDQSYDVNSFYVNDIRIWLDKVTRVGLMLRFDSELKIGKSETSLWYEDNEFVLPISTAINILNSIEIYAS